MLRALLGAAAALAAAATLAQDYGYSPAASGPALSAQAGPAPPQQPNPAPAYTYAPPPAPPQVLSGPGFTSPSGSSAPAWGTTGTPALPGTVEMCSPSGWLLGAGFYFLQPRWGNNPAYDRLSSTATDTGETDENVQEDFDVKAHFAPLVWLGYVGPQGIGIRERWWQLRASSGVSVDNPREDGFSTTTIYSAYPLGVGFAAQSSPDFSSALQFDSNLAMDVSDTEILFQLHPWRGSLLLGAGVRYAHLSQNYQGSWTSTPVDTTQDTTNTLLTSGHNFSGIGPLVSLEARYPIGTTHFSLTGALRGALLFGTGSQSVAMTTTTTDSTGGLVDQTTLNKSRSIGGTMPVIEFELGGQWDYQLSRYRFLVETALVGQAWFYAGNAANQQSIFGGLSPYDNKDLHDALGLVGLRLNAGFSY